MNRVLMLPTPGDAAQDLSNSINQIVHRLAKHLPTYGWTVTENPAEADLIAGHAGAASAGRVDVSHCHGLYPTEEMPSVPWYWGANRQVIDNLRQAQRITVPSQWVADILRRDMHIDPAVIGWAIDPADWTPPAHPGRYVLWGKTRVDGVCSPANMVKFALAAPDQPFVSTFADNAPPNVTVIGRRSFEQIVPVIQGAGIYLADVKETFGIMTLEAMACGVPVLGYRWGGTADIVEHGVDGYLVEPGDIDGLVEGLAYCWQHRAVLGANARAKALTYTWDRVAEQIAAQYDAVLAEREPKRGPKVSVVIPCHNYARYVGEAIESVHAQATNFPVEVIVVDDLSTDDSRAVASTALGDAGTLIVNETNQGVARSRNQGIEAAQGEYIVCLDADDRLGDPRFLQVLADALDADRMLGIAFTGLTPIDADGNLGALSAWPNGFDYDRQTQGANQVPTCCMFRRVAWERAGGYRKAYQPSEDARLWLLIGALGFDARQITADGWFHYRIHDGSLSDGIRKGERPEPPWRAALPWIEDKKRPMAALGIPQPNRYSWPVRNYDRPLATFIIPVGPGHQRYLPDALDSLEAQTERRWQAIVVNDTGAPLQPYLKAYPWARVIDTAGRLGAGVARNRGVAAARSALVAFLDADDVLEPTFLAQTLRAARRAGRYAYTDWVSLNKAGVFERHETPEYKEGDAFSKSSIHAVNVLIPRAWVMDVGGFDESMSSWEDVDFFMRLAARGYCGVRVAEPLLIYRYTTGSRRESGEPIKDDLRALLYDRYRDFMEGRRKVVCVCDQVTLPSGPAIPPELAARDPRAAEYVRVEYSGGPRAPVAAHAVVGPATGQNYGQRAKGDVFLIYRADLMAAPTMFAEVVTVAPQAQKTPPPPPPVLRYSSAAS